LGSTNDRRRLLVAPLLLAAAALSAQEVPSSWPTTAQPSPQIIRTACNGPVRGVLVLRNGQDVVGGYVAVPGIMDSPIACRDAAGQLLTVFHIFDTDAGKAAASAIVQRLKAEFPREEFVACAGNP
jgi:hypothetical protein